MLYNPLFFYNRNLLSIYRALNIIKCLTAEIWAGIYIYKVRSDA